MFFYLLVRTLTCHAIAAGCLATQSADVSIFACPAFVTRRPLGLLSYPYHIPLLLHYQSRALPSTLAQSDPAFADKVKHLRDAKSRMSVVWSHCKSKNHCEPDVIEENEGEVPDEVVPVKKGHGGCGHIQPQIRKEGLKLFLQYKKTKDEDDMVCVLSKDVACFSL